MGDIMLMYGKSNDWSWQLTHTINKIWIQNADNLPFIHFGNQIIMFPVAFATFSSQTRLFLGAKSQSALRLSKNWLEPEFCGLQSLALRHFQQWSPFLRWLGSHGFQSWLLLFLTKNLIWRREIKQGLDASGVFQVHGLSSQVSSTPTLCKKMKAKTNAGIWLKKACSVGEHSAVTSSMKNP